MIVDIVYVLFALAVLFIPMGFAWVVVRWMSRRRPRGDDLGRDAPTKLHPPRHAERHRPRRRPSESDAQERSRSSSVD